MKFPHNINRNLAGELRVRMAIRLLSLSLLTFGSVLWLTPSALGIPPWHSIRGSAYPPAFVQFMDFNYGKMWMHTVQEQIVRRIYVIWLEKENASSKDKQKR